MKDNIIKRYIHDGITVVWQPSKCSHSKLCFHGLPAVFNPQNRPWIQLENSTSDDIRAQVRKCPSGALTIDGENLGKGQSEVDVNVTQGGPLLVSGLVTITLANGQTIEKSGMTALCRCGASGNKPYCDGSHSKIEFDD